MGRHDLVDDERTRSGTARAANRAFVDEVVGGWFAGLSRAEAVERLNGAGVPTGPVHTAEDVFACPQVAARRMLTTIEDPEVGAYQYARTPPHLSTAPVLPARPAPRLGEHTRPVLQDLLGYSAAEVEAMMADGVVG